MLLRDTLESSDVVASTFAGGTFFVENADGGCSALFTPLSPATAGFVGGALGFALDLLDTCLDDTLDGRGGTIGSSEVILASEIFFICDPIPPLIASVLFDAFPSLLTIFRVP